MFKLFALHGVGVRRALDARLLLSERRRLFIARGHLRAALRELLRRVVVLLRARRDDRLERRELALEFCHRGLRGGDVLRDRDALRRRGLALNLGVSHPGFDGFNLVAFGRDVGARQLQRLLRLL